MYDMKVIKAIPIADVARKYGIQLEKKHDRYWCNLRDEKTASLSINIAKNLWYDFGSGRGGGVIDFVSEVEGICAKDAINKLAEEFGIKNEIAAGWRPLTDNQYREVGIEPERATLNFNFDLRVHTPEQLHRWNEKYGMHVRELAEKMPEEYNQFVMKFGQAHISPIREAYLTKLKVSLDATVSIEQRQLHRKWAEIDVEDINRKVELLQRAVKGNISFAYLKADPAADIKNIANQNQNDMSEEVQIRDKVVTVYKQLFNFTAADYITIEIAKAIVDLNRTVSYSNDRYLDISEIKKLYNIMGDNLQKLERTYNDVMNERDSIYRNKSSPGQLSEWDKKLNNMKTDINNIKVIFSKCSDVVNGIREATLAYRNDIAKQTASENTNTKGIEKTEFVR